MGHTLPDYTTKYKLVKVFGQIDSGELAARNGALSLLDRRGNTVWYDDFEAAAAVKWEYDLGVGAAAALSTDRAYLGNQSMKTTTAADIGNVALLKKSFCLPMERHMGVEFMFCITSGKPIITLILAACMGTRFYQPEFKYDHNTEKLYYMNSAGAWVELTRYDSVVTTKEPWFYVKLVIDWDAPNYLRLIFCGTEYDLSGIPMLSFASVLKKHVEVYINNTAATAAVSTVYFDNFIFTQNEP